MKSHIEINLSYQDASASMILRGESYSPDVIDDLVRRAQESLVEIMRTGYELAGPEPDDTLATLKAMFEEGAADASTE